MIVIIMLWNRLVSSRKGPCLVSQNCIRWSALSHAYYLVYDGFRLVEYYVFVLWNIILNKNHGYHGYGVCLFMYMFFLYMLHLLMDLLQYWYKPYIDATKSIEVLGHNPQFLVKVKFRKFFFPKRKSLHFCPFQLEVSLFPWHLFLSL